MLSEDTSICSCPQTSNKGVFIKKIIANQNTELWGSYSKTKSHYNFDCNHTMLSEGNHAFFPFEPIEPYDNKDPHIHYQYRLRDPHSTSKDEWKEMKMTKCECDISPQNIFTSEIHVHSGFLEASLDAK